MITGLPEEVEVESAAGKADRLQREAEGRKMLDAFKIELESEGVKPFDGAWTYEELAKISSDRQRAKDESALREKMRKTA